MRPPKLLFFATEDWFVRSHFMPLVRRAMADGYDVAVAARHSGVDLEGARLIEAPISRGSMATLAGEAAWLRGLLRAERPDIVHVVALRPILQALLAGSEGAARVFAVTGRGYLSVRGAPWTRAVLRLLAWRLRAAVANGAAVLMVENEADRRWVERDAPLPDERVALMPGAGVDPDKFTPKPAPQQGPIVIGVVSRLVWSKGVDLAVEAVRRLRAEGLDVELRIAGGADADNPEHVAEEEIARWAATPGVRLLGRVRDINGFWADAHIACLPSRGGEGLPRSLLEAAACARPIVTTDTPGCGDFVRHGGAGLVAPPQNVDALAKALRTLATGAMARAQMGAAARACVEAGYSEAHAADVAAAAWRRLLAR